MHVLCFDVGYTSVPHLQIPKDKTVKVKIIQRLVSNKVWEGVSYLVIGVYSGEHMELAATFSELDFAFVPVGNLLQETTLLQQKSWGIQLAMTLLEKGASYQQMELYLGKAAIHIGVQSALETGRFENILKIGLIRVKLHFI